MDYCNDIPGSTWEHVWRLTWNHANMSQELCGVIIRIELDDLGNYVRDIHTVIRLVSTSHGLSFVVRSRVVTSQWMLDVMGIGYGWRTIVLKKKTSSILKSRARATQSQSDMWQGQITCARASQAQSQQCTKARVENRLRREPNCYVQQGAREKMQVQLIRVSDKRDTLT